MERRVGSGRKRVVVLTAKASSPPAVPDTLGIQAGSLAGLIIRNTQGAQ